MIARNGSSRLPKQMFYQYVIKEILLMEQIREVNLLSY
jgi:hypothetical protein